MTNKKAFLFLHLFILNIFSLSAISAEPITPIKIAVLKYGTVNWTLDTIKTNQLDKKYGIDLIITPLASTQAGKVSLQANASDVIVSDWTWVARQRGNNASFLFYPYSTTTGSIMVPDTSPIKSVADLADQRVGIAGGALDKSWLLMRAYGFSKDIDFDARIDKVFGAPPLLNNLLQQEKIDALINFWHYSARLKAQGYREITNTHAIINSLGIKETVPMLGYVFRDAWGSQKPEAVNGLIKATKEAGNLLCNSDTHWNNIVFLTRTKDSRTQKILRNSYCEGVINEFTEKHKQAIANIYGILAKTGGSKLVGSVNHLNPDIFWDISQH